MSVRITSLNVNGLNEKEKRHKLFFWLKERNADIVLLQETHIDNDETLSRIKTEWQGDIHASYGTTAARGVAILVKPKLNLNLQFVEKDQHGRYIIIKLDIDEKQLILINVYAPNEGGQKRKFIKDIAKSIKTINPQDTYEVIIGGDFNCTQKATLDRRYEKKSNVSGHPDIGNREIKNLKEQLGLEDCWRRRFPALRRYTYHRKNTSTASRIDYWLTSKSLDSYIVSTTIQTAPLTDHNMITINVKTTEFISGKGTWKMNGSMLKEEQFTNTFKTFWKEWKESISKHKDKLKWWELTKVKIKELSIACSKARETQRTKYENYVNSMIEKEENKTSVDTFKLNKLKEEQSILLSQKYEGAKIRSRVLLVEKDEKPTKYFYDKEKVRGKNKQWASIETEDGEIKRNLDEIIAEQVKFYSKLFKGEGINEDAADELLQNVDAKISNKQKEECESLISEYECSNAIKTLKNNKSPGEDGILSEFYKIFWEDIKKEFMIVIEYIQKHNLLSQSQYRGIITLLYKNGNRENIKNWRPITLMNIDYKIIAKIFGERLKKVLPTIIHADQRAFIEGRFISESIRLSQDLFEYACLNNIEGAVIALDQEKAYDRVEWQWLQKCLSKFGFGKKFLNWIMMLYKFGESAIKTNGYISKYFPISRSMRQGCPIAAYLYILQAEPLAEAIRKSKDIQGIPLPIKVENVTIEAKISIFADDTQLYCRNKPSIKNAFKILELYAKASGARINYKKTKGVSLNPRSKNNYDFEKIEWVDSVKTLGVVIGHNINYEEIWMQKFTKFKNNLQLWKQRSLTIFGKILLLNSYIFSGINHLIEMYPHHIPQNMSTTIKNLCTDFIWGTKKNSVALKTLTLLKDHGGLQLKCFDTLVKTKQAQWIYKITTSKVETWNNISKHQLKIPGNLFRDENYITQSTDLKHLNKYIQSKFLVTCLKGWSELLKQNPTTKDEILQQNIFNNHLIKSKGICLHLRHWHMSGFVTINDIWNNDTNTWLNGQNIFNQLIQKLNWIAEYSLIKSVIPIDWKRKLKGEHVDEIKSDTIELCKKYSVKIVKGKILKDDKEIVPSKLKSKLLYVRLMYPSKMPRCMTSWKNIFHTDLEWESIFQNINTTTQLNKVKEFHWKSIHRALFSEMRLKSMGKSDGICTICKTEEETSCHILYECQTAQAVWQKLAIGISKIVNIQVDFSLAEVIFCDIKLEDKNLAHLESMIIMEGKWQIWKNRNNVKFDSKIPRTSGSIVCSVVKQCNTLLQGIYACDKRKQVVEIMKSLYHNYFS